MKRPTRLITVIATTAAIAAPGAVLLASNAHAATTLFAYANGAASPPGCPAQGTPSNGCSLTTAIASAASGDTIALATPGASASYIGGWTVSQSLTIQPAPGVTNPTLDGDGEARILSISTGAVVGVNGVTLTNGASGASGGAAAVAGGAELDLTSSTVSDSSATGNGGGIANSGTTVINTSTLTGNSSDQIGGAVYNSGTLTVHNSTFTANTGNTGGGAIAHSTGFSTSPATITGTTFDDNSSGDDGGAILNGNGTNGVLSVSTSTFSGNSAEGEGGAIYNGEAAGHTDALSVTASTFVADTADSGPAIAVGFTSTVGTVTVAGDLFAEGCSKGVGTWTDNGHNAGVDGTCLNSGTGNQTDANVSSLGKLADNGGPTKTVLPIAPNAAIGMIPNPTSALCPRTDQRGFASAGACTAGAVEPNGVALGGGGGGGGGPGPLTVTVTSSNNPSNTGDPVTFTATLSPVPTCGSVSWLIDNVPPPAGTPTAGSGSTFTLGPISSLSAGVHPVTAVFSGCPAFGAASGSVNEEVDTPGSTPTPTPTQTGTGTGPSIVANVTSAHHRHHGWYRSPVHISFTCVAGAAPLAGPCPDPVVLRHDGQHQTVTRTITDTSGQSASTTVVVNIDRTKPTVEVAGVRNGHTYRSPRSLSCVAVDGLSGVASCTIVQHHHHIKGTDDVVHHYVATATDNAGNRATIRGSYTLS